MRGIKGHVLMMLFSRVFRGLALGFLLGMIGSTVILIIGLLLGVGSLMGAIFVIMGLAMKLMLWALLLRVIMRGG